MGEAKPVDWYDAAYRDDPNLTADLERSTFAPLWLEMARRVPDRANVLEVGCGAGQLAELLIPKVRNYAGYDWSSVAIAEARRRVPALHGRIEVVSVSDQIATAYFERRSGKRLDFVTVLACEVLEHLDAPDDVALIDAHSGARVLFSLPSRDSESHVRWFETYEAIVDRYGPWIAGIEISRFGQWWIIEGRAR